MWYPCVYAVGHGESEGERAHIDSFKIYYDDVISHVEDTVAEYPGVPCFLMGHSNVCANYILVSAHSCIY